MKTYPITDHVPEAELLAITPEGAAWWLRNKGWAQVVDGNTDRWRKGPGILTLVYDREEHVICMAGLVQGIGRREGIPPRTIIAEMQADSRIVAELQRMAAKKAAAPTNRESGKVEP